MTAHAEPSMRHSMGTIDVERMMMPAIRMMHISHGTQKRLRIFGISSQKFERSTSFFVAPHVMLYEKRCARSACERWMLRPPKKKKL